MKTSNVLIRLFILALLFTPFLTTTEASAQPPCGGATPCGTPGDCYAAPKVSCEGGAQLGHIITSYCNAATNEGLCDPGLFVCMSTTIPSAWSGCTCSGANNCIYISIRNLIDCGDHQAIWPKITKVELRLNKHSSSTSSFVCGAKQQWTTSWTVTGGACSTWVGTQREVTTEAASSSDYVDPLEHYTAVVCGASSVDIKVTYQMDDDSPPTMYTNPNWLTGIPVNSDPCPEYGDDHDWCQP